MQIHEAISLRLRAETLAFQRDMATLRLLLWDVEHAEAYDLATARNVTRRNEW